MLAPQDGQYTFSTLSDDGVQLWVNGQLLIDDWNTQGPTWESGTITLQAGQLYDLTLNYFQNWDGDCAYLDWSYPGRRSN